MPPNLVAKFEATEFVINYILNLKMLKSNYYYQPQWLRPSSTHLVVKTTEDIVRTCVTLLREPVLTLLMAARIPLTISAVCTGRSRVQVC